MPFRIGDVVELVSRVGMSAPLGSLATVRKVGKEYIVVDWIEKTHSQQNGGYDANRFVLAEKPMEDTREYLEAVTM